jgi:hypothetical protein
MWVIRIALSQFECRVNEVIAVTRGKNPDVHLLPLFDRSGLPLPYWVSAADLLNPLSCFMHLGRREALSWIRPRAIIRQKRTSGLARIEAITGLMVRLTYGPGEQARRREFHDGRSVVSGTSSIDQIAQSWWGASTAEWSAEQRATPVAETTDPEPEETDAEDVPPGRSQWERIDTDEADEPPAPV